MPPKSYLNHKFNKDQINPNINSNLNSQNLFSNNLTNLKEKEKDNSLNLEEDKQTYFTSECKYKN